MIVAVTSWRGWGTTTTALALATAAALNGEAWLIEADPAGGVLAGRLPLPRTALGGLERVAFPVEQCSIVEAWHDVAHDHGRVRVVSAPAEPFRALACHRPRVDWIGGLRELPGTVVVDAGRLRPGSPTWPLLHAADVVVCVTAAEVSAAVTTSEWLHVDGRVGPGERGIDAARVRVVFVDGPGGVAFSRATLQADFDAHYAGWLPWDAVGVDRLHSGALRRGPLWSAAQRVAAHLAASIAAPAAESEAVGVS